MTINFRNIFFYHAKGTHALSLSVVQKRQRFLSLSLSVCVCVFLNASPRFLHPSSPLLLDPTSVAPGRPNRRSDVPNRRFSLSLPSPVSLLKPALSLFLSPSIGRTPSAPPPILPRTRGLPRCCSLSSQDSSYSSSSPLGVYLLRRWTTKREVFFLFFFFRVCFRVIKIMR